VEFVLNSNIQNHMHLSLKSSRDEITKVDDLINQIVEQFNLSDDLHGTMAISVTEMVNNGIIHGNKLDIDKIVTLDIDINEEKIIFKIQDQGSGFKVEDIPDPLKEENLMKSSGRGVHIVNQMVQLVTFIKNEIGMLVTLEFSRN
jgi:serine/threonine-protein kinase RsbW